MSRKNIIYLVSTLVLALLLFFGYRYAQSMGYFDNKKMYKIEFDNVLGLAPGADVTCMGLKIGKVKRMYVKEDDPKFIIAELLIDDSYNIPKSTVAAMKSGGITSGNFLEMEFSEICQGDDCAPEGYFLKNRTVGMIENMFGKTPSETELGFGNDDAKEMLEVWKTKVISEDSDHIIGITLQNMKDISSKMDQLQKEMKSVTDESMTNYEVVMSNLDNVTQSLDSAKLERIFADLDVLSKKMESIDLDKPMKHAESTMKNVAGMEEKAKVSMEDLNKTMNDAKVIFAELETLKERMNSSDGSVKYLMAKDGMTKDLNEALIHLNQLSQDLEYKAYNYKPFLSRRKFLRKNPDKKEIPN